MNEGNIKKIETFVSKSNLHTLHNYLTLISNHNELIYRLIFSDL